MSGFLWRVGGALAAGVLGLALIFWQLEHASLNALGDLGRPSIAVYGLLFAGLLLLGWAVMSTLTRWIGYLREHPETRQLPAWLLGGLALLFGAVLVAGIVIHASYLRAQDPVPTEISQGFIAYEVAFAALAIVPGVLLVARLATRRAA
ncbi:hypothetical protein [Demequina lignilytica]|uniref:Uncharacterized protein n=1 Tax=Demequina lignilytica TaxID=3051663 RepID=A0AB35MJ00_9MICO|nr:hypothetical protein [Demequina sp. SYSU T0a273]MDN4483758.1 hypothetical protein [Demequina sp. SYSU T0a273]